MVETAENGKPPYNLYGGDCPTAQCALEGEIPPMIQRRRIVAVPYADYGNPSPLVAIPNPCWHRWAAILHTFALLIFKSANNFFQTIVIGRTKNVWHTNFPGFRIPARTLTGCVCRPTLKKYRYRIHHFLAVVWSSSCIWLEELDSTKYTLRGILLWKLPYTSRY